MKTRAGGTMTSLAWLLALVGLACSTPASPGEGDQLPAGTWGGQHVELDVTAAGGTITFDCAHGRIDEPIVPDRTGRFEVRGMFAAEHPGPQREDEDGQPARYVGQVSGKTMTLTVYPASGADPIGSFTLEQGKNGVIRKCA
jgi:hypothetical protein